MGSWCAVAVLVLERRVLGREVSMGKGEDEVQQ
jgi:hypothetical protein